MYMFAFNLYQAALKKVCVLVQVEEGAKKMKKNYLCDCKAMSMHDGHLGYTLR